MMAGSRYAKADQEHPVTCKQCARTLSALRDQGQDLSDYAYHDLRGSSRVKRQYCWDARDYFKYDLLGTLREGLGEWMQLSCIWMLTPDDGSSDGKTQFVANRDLAKLTELFVEQQALGKDGIGLRAMRDYFAPPYFSYRDERPPYFGANRREYFEEIPNEALSRSLVFFDPDKGMEAPRSLTPAHLRFEELEKTFKRMDSESVAVVFQYRWHVLDFWTEMAEKLGRSVSSTLAYVVEGNVGFYVAPKSDHTLPVIEQALIKVCSRGKKRFFHV